MPVLRKKKIKNKQRYNKQINIIFNLSWILEIAVKVIWWIWLRIGICQALDLMRVSKDRVLSWHISLKVPIEQEVLGLVAVIAKVWLHSQLVRVDHGLGQARWMIHVKRIAQWKWRRCHRRRKITLIHWRWLLLQNKCSRSTCFKDPTTRHLRVVTKLRSLWQVEVCSTLWVAFNSTTCSSQCSSRCSNQCSSSTSFRHHQTWWRSPIHHCNNSLKAVNHMMLAPKASTPWNSNYPTKGPSTQ